MRGTKAHVSRPHQRTLELLARALQAACMDAPSSGAGAPQPASIDWSELIEVAVSGRLMGLLVIGLDRLGWRPRQDFIDAADRECRKAFVTNTRTLASIPKIVEALQEARLRFVVFKGPLQHLLGHKTYFIRSSVDIDILVPRISYDKAAAVIQDIGYELPSQFRTKWWRYYLGEQSFVDNINAMTSIDLHHRLQQPGNPRPRFLDDYMKCPEFINIGGFNVPVMNKINSTLLFCMSFVKAFSKGVPSFVYICEYSVLTSKMNEEEILELITSADRHGLLNTLYFTMECGMILLSAPSLPFIPGKHLSYNIDYNQLLYDVAAPAKVFNGWPGRPLLLWKLCDPRKRTGRFLPFAFEWGIGMAASFSKKWNRPYFQKLRVRARR